jgi:hypothetical protein
VVQEDDRKRVIVKIAAKRHAELKVRLHYDNLTQTAFFRAVTEAYINRDELIVDFIENYKQVNGLQSEHKRKKIADANNQRAETIRKFALEDTEIDSLYDLVEKEFPDL